MKSQRRQVTDYVTIYISEDGLCESEDSKVVEEYEATCNYKTFEPVFLIDQTLLDYENPLAVYDCENEQDFQALLSFIKRENPCISNRGLQDARDLYNSEQRYWTATVECNRGDGPDYLYINPLSRVACEMKGVIIGTKDALNKLEDQFEEVKKLLKE